MTRPRDESVPAPRRSDATTDAGREARALQRRAERAADRAAELAAEAEEARRGGRGGGAGTTGRLAGVGARGTAGEEYYYRRKLGVADLVTAAGIGLGAAAAAFYFASVLMQRTPLEAPRPPRNLRPARRGPLRDAGTR